MDKLYIALSIIAAAVIGGLIGKFFRHEKQPLPGEEEAGRAKGEKQDEIKNTPASDLVDADSDAGKLRADAAGIAGRAKQRLRDRAKRVISRLGGTGDIGGSGK
jgi:hypothetical protein